MYLLGNFFLLSPSVLRCLSIVPFGNERSGNGSSPEQGDTAIIGKDLLKIELAFPLSASVLRLAWPVGMSQRPDAGRIAGDFCVADAAWWRCTIH